MARARAKGDTPPAVTAFSELAVLDMPKTLDLVPAMVAVYNIQTGKYLYVSKSVRKILGFSPREFVSRGMEFVASLVHPDDIAMVMAKNELALRAANKRQAPMVNDDEALTFEYRMRHKRGHYVWLRTDGRVYDRDARNKVMHVINVSTNITEQKQTEEKLRQLGSELEARVAERSERLEVALEASQMGIWEWDVKTNELSWSDELKKLFGLKKTDAISFDKYMQLIAPEDRSRSRKVFRDALKHGKSYEIEHRIVWSDGSVHWIMGDGRAIMENGKAVRMIGTARNIDNRQEYVIRLQESEERFRRMADSAPVMIWIAGPDKKVTYFNKVWLDFTGRTFEQEIGEGWRETFYPPHLNKVVKTYYTAFDKRKPYRLESKIRYRDGTYRWILDNGRPWFAPSGEFLGFIGSCIDIDEVKQATERRRKLELKTAELAAERRQLMALNRAKDEFISLASHQLRTPATGVKQYLGMVLEGYVGEVPEQQRYMLQKAYSSNDRQLKVLNDLLLVAKIDAGKLHIMREVHNLSQLVKDVVQEQRLVFQEKKQNVRLHLPQNLEVPMDAKYIRMVLENLINNASKYSPVGRTVYIHGSTNQKHASLSVKDEGIGISKQDQSKLYQKFSRLGNNASSNIDSNGLGLYWSKKIVDLHKGKLILTSQLRKGSTFTLKLPLD